MNAQGFVSRRGADQMSSSAVADLREQARRLARELAPRLAMKSRREIRWMYRAAVRAFCDEMDQVWRAKIAAMPTVAARGASGVSRSEGQRRDSGGRLSRGGARRSRE